MVINDFALTGDYQLDHILRRTFKEERKKGCNVTRLTHDELLASKLDFKYYGHYKMQSLACENKNSYSYLLFMAMDYDANTVMIFIDTED